MIWKYRNQNLNYMENCKSCCPLKVIEDYKNLEKGLSKDFDKQIKKWFDEHPYVDRIFVIDSVVCFSNSMYFHGGDIKSTVYLKE